MIIYKTMSQLERKQIELIPNMQNFVKIQSMEGCSYIMWPSQKGREILYECYTSIILIAKVSQLSQSVAGVINNIMKCRKCHTSTIMV